MIGRLVRGFLKLVAAVVIVVGIAAVVAVVLVEWNCRPTGEARVAAPPLVEDDGYKRTEANTYWTFPEWYIVYSFEDFGAFLETRPESAFPYMSQIAGFWQSACAANRVAAALPGEHFEMKQMIYVIGISYTLELAIKAVYENTIGRLTEALRDRPTAEDIYARGVVQEYGTFLHQTPWYEFPFMDKLAGLWDLPQKAGDNPFRAVERRLSLSAEYLAKAGYGKAIGFLAGSLTAPLPPDIMFVAVGDVAGFLAVEPTVRAVRTLDDGGVLLSTPRYRVFTELLKRNADGGIDVVEIAGNRHILMTAIVPSGVTPAAAGATEMFAVPVDARPGFTRNGYDVAVPALMTVLAAFAADGVDVEHVYDY